MTERVEAIRRMRADERQRPLSAGRLWSGDDMDALLTGVDDLQAALARVRELAADLTNQFALRATHNGAPVVISGCLSDMEAAFAYFSIPDPCPEAEFLPRLRAALEGRG